MKKEKVIILILAVLLIAAVVYIGVDAYSKIRTREFQASFASGYNQGYRAAVTQTFQSAATCRPVPINIGNQTLNLIAVECLQAAQQRAVGAATQSAGTRSAEASGAGSAGGGEST